ncbi:MAG: T9SS type A sorting domain-containing protein [Clostridia bacterium]|nr:T9SS type A sorting domain-containing protein [Clostridia bacterium]
MKNLTILLLLLLPEALVGQNWQVVNPEYTYFFSGDDPGLIARTVKTDSVSTATGHPLYYLNTTIQFCDTCYGPVPCFNYEFEFYEYYHPNVQGLFAKEVHQLDNGRYWFFDTVSFVIHSKASLNQSWLFDTIHNITAQISSIYWQETFPAVYDSVKTISLSDGREVMLSKNYGILGFPSQTEPEQSFDLIGMKTQTENVGVTPPGFWEIFDIEVGDVFQYAGLDGDDSFPPPNSDYYTMKVRITSKAVTDSSVTFGQHIIKKHLGLGYLNIQDITRSYYNTPTFIANQLPGTLYDICADDQGFNGMCDAVPYHLLSEMHHERSPILTDIVSIGNYAYQDDALRLVPCEEGTELMMNVMWDYGFFDGNAYASGLGQTAKRHEDFLIFDSYNLQGFVKNGDTTGLVTPDDVLLNVNEKPAGAKASLHPNPATQRVFLNIAEETEVWIFDLKGQPLFHQKFDAPTNEIDLEKYSPGVYFVKTITTQNSWSQKLIVK